MKFKNRLLFCICGVLIVFITACNSDDSKNVQVLFFDFAIDKEGWQADYADYPNSENMEELIAFNYAHASLPFPLNEENFALKLKGINRSDDLFMFIKKSIVDLEPNMKYHVHIEIEIATNAPKDWVGIGGAPGESVYIKAGASNIEPLKVLDDENYYRMNIDIGNQSESGTQAVVIGNFANGLNEEVYQLKTLKTKRSIPVISNSEGEIWILIGTDSGFEGESIIFYNHIKVVLN